jgi:hypothetical protein
LYDRRDLVKATRGFHKAIRWHGTIGDLLDPDIVEEVSKGLIYAAAKLVSRCIAAPGNAMQGRPWDRLLRSSGDFRMKCRKALRREWLSSLRIAGIATPSLRAKLRDFLILPHWAQNSPDDIYEIMVLYSKVSWTPKTFEIYLCPTNFLMVIFLWISTCTFHVFLIKRYML